MGRLVTVSSTGTVNHGESTTIAYDAAGNRTNYAIGGVAVTPVVSIGNASAAEGGALSFPVTLSGVSNANVTVQYATTGGTATSDSDFTAASGTLTIAAGQTGGTISVATLDDAAAEASETLTVTLSSPTGASLGTAAGTGTIVDNDSIADLAIGSASVVEEDAMVMD